VATGVSLRAKLEGDVQAAGAAELLPHHRRDALYIVKSDVDILDVALAIAEDRAPEVAGLIESESLYRPSLAQLSDWCVDLELRFQFVILQPYVLAQPIEGSQSGDAGAIDKTLA